MVPNKDSPQCVHLHVPTLHAYLTCACRPANLSKTVTIVPTAASLGVHVLLAFSNGGHAVFEFRSPQRLWSWLRSALSIVNTSCKSSL